MTTSRTECLYILIAYWSFDIALQLRFIFDMPIELYASSLRLASLLFIIKSQFHLVNQAHECNYVCLIPTIEILLDVKDLGDIWHFSAKNFPTIFFQHLLVYNLDTIFVVFRIYFIPSLNIINHLNWYQIQSPELISDHRLEKEAVLNNNQHILHTKILWENLNSKYW